MKKTLCILIVGLLYLLFSFGSGRCAETDFRFPVGIVYNSGVSQILDKIKTNYESSNQYALPIGLAFQPYVEFDFGLGIGGSLGPSTSIAAKIEEEGAISYMIPVGFDLRYTFFRNKDVSPYIRGGIRYPIVVVVTGDLIKSGKIGPFAGIGFEFFRSKKVAVALEVSYDGSKVEVPSGGKGARPDTQKEEVNTGGLIAGFFVVF